MKKITSILLAVLMLLSLSATVFAADTQSTEITMTIDPSMESYTLTIPATVQIDPAEKNGEIDIELSEVNLYWNTFLTVYANSANHIDGEDGSYLVATADDTKKISYSVQSECTGDSSFEATDQGLFVAGYTAAHEWRGSSYSENLEDGKLTLTVDGSIPGAGTYTDTLTFSVQLETMSDRYDIPNRNVSVEETRAFLDFVGDEYDKYFNEYSANYDGGTYRVVSDSSEASSGEKYVLESDLDNYYASIAANETAYVTYFMGEKNGTQEDLNSIYYDLETAWKDFWSTKIYRKP